MTPEAMKPRAIRIAGSGKVLNVEPTKVADEGRAGEQRAGECSK
jgi:hypothetical protein